MLMNGNVQRVETSRPDPTIVLFERYAFDLSRFTGGTQVTTFGVRERSLWEVAFPDPEDPVYKQQPTGFRAGGFRQRRGRCQAAVGARSPARPQH